MDRFEELYERYCDGALSPTERSEFVQLMTDPRVRERFVEAASFEAVLSEEASLAPSASKGDSSKERRAVSRSRLAAHRVRRAEAARTVWPFALAAAALFAIVVLVLASGSGTPVPPRPVAPEAPVAAGDPPAVDSVKSVKRMPAPLPDRPPVPGRQVDRRPSVPRSVPPAPKRNAAPVTPRPRIPETKPIKPKAVPPTRPEKRTVAFIGQVERAEGNVRIRSGGAESVAAVGTGLKSGDAILAGAGATVRYSDGTRLELGADAVLSRFAEDEAGKSVQVERGLLWVDAQRQPKGRTMVVIGPHAEASILGTSFSLNVTADFTRLDVYEGKVKFTLSSGVTSRTLTAGQYAVAGKGHPFAIKARYTGWKAPARGLILWLGADRSIKLEGDTVAEWTDRSRWRNTAAQAAAASRPRRVADALGGMPAVRFDGVDDFLALPDGFKDFRAGLSAFVVLRVGPKPDMMRILDLGKGPQCENIFFGRRVAGDTLSFWAYSNSITRGKVEIPNAILFDRPQTLSVVASGQGKVTLFRNGAAVGTGVTSAPPNVVRSPNYIGRSNYAGGDPRFKGDIGEILLFNRALPENERAYVEAYLRVKYFDPTAPPHRAR